IAPPRPPAPLVVRAGPASARIPPALRARLAGNVQGAAAWLAARSRFASAQASGIVSWDEGDAAALASAADAEGPAVELTPTVLRVRVTVPVIRQVFRNNCETAALSMALRGRVGQERLQRLLPLEEPLDPVQGPAGLVWGDPERGFVGRVEGGGYGVFEGPLARLAQRFDPGAHALRGGGFEKVLARVREGRPVVVWTTLGPSAPRRWTTRTGAVVLADQAHHTVVLTGIDAEGVRIADPWTGTTTTATVGAIEEGWRTLGRRAVVLSPVRASLTRTSAAPRIE
ncbi:MAG TPA: C39 family peptidase, partial [Miltoncostaeaceae bacterium]|nr:C39 family peptidase [Miltoncostaeaceae bacterium]